jgi:hypothetical protein
MSDDWCGDGRNEWEFGEERGAPIEGRGVHHEYTYTAESRHTACSRFEMLDGCAERGRNKGLFDEEEVRLDGGLVFLLVWVGGEGSVGILVFAIGEGFEEDGLGGFDYDEGWDDAAECVFNHGIEREEEQHSDSE